MASLHKRPSKGKNGKRAFTWIVQYTATDGTRPAIVLGRCGEATANNIKGYVEDLLNAKRMQQTPDKRTASWVGDLGDDMHLKLSKLGLVEPRHKPATATLGAFLDAYVAGRNDIKPATAEVWGQTVRNLKTHFGADRELPTINEGHADDFKQYLIGEKLSPYTVAKRLQFARMFFRAAVRRKLIASNPFAEVGAKAIITKETKFVTRKETEAILEECNPEWRLIVALARYGGLRCPTEVLSLRWSDINWQAGRIVVTSPKTEHHEGKGSRVIPLFPELRKILEEGNAIAGDGADYLLPRYRQQSLTSKGWRNCNLRTQFERIVKRASLSPWPNLFKSLRASRETELAAEYPLHVVTAWLGNTPRIAQKHYLMVRDDDFARAANVFANSFAEPSSTGLQQEETPADPTSKEAEFAGVCGSVHGDATEPDGEDRIRTCGRA